MRAVLMVAAAGLVVRMIVVRVIVVRMTVMRVVARGLRRLIGPCVGLERRLDMADLGAQSAHHVLEHVIAAHAQPVGENLRRRVTVSHVIGDAGELARVRAAHFRELLGRGDDLDQPSILQHQRIAAAQRHRFGKVEQEFRSPRGLHGDAAPVAALIIEHDRVGRRGPPCALGGDEIRADHGRSLDWSAAAIKPSGPLCTRFRRESARGPAQYMK